jgi:hypothetical protein
MARKRHPSEANDHRLAFVAPALVLFREDSPQRDLDLREIDEDLP